MTTNAKRSLGAAIAALLVLNVVALTTIRSDSGYPTHWDKRLDPLAAFVEKTRHLRYAHAVKVSYLAPADYKKRILDAGNGGPTAQEKADITRFTAQLRALGLVDKKTDLLRDTNELQSGGTDAFYDPSTEEIVVFGTKIDVATRVTLVHEMTHALQDQQFDLSREFAADGESSLYQALGEGDATRVENAYIDQLSDVERAAYEKSFNERSADHGTVSVAPTLEQLFGAPYVLGEPMTTLVAQVKGTAGLDKLFRRPIASDEGLTNIFALLDGDKPKPVKAPTLNPGEKLTDKAAQFTTVAWYLTLASFIDEKVALRAVDGWGGDSEIGYSAGGRECVRIAFVGDTPTDTAEMQAALDQWKKSFSPERVNVIGNAGRVEVSACEPDVIPSPRAGSGKSLVLPVSRLQFLSGAYAQGVPRATAECLSREFLNQVTIAALLKADTDSTDFIQQARSMARTCRAEKVV